MPEGPEVEIVRRGLKKITNKKIKGIIYSNHEKYSGQGKKAFSKLIGTEIKQIKRKGKWLLFHFKNNTKAINHLGMSGKWLIFNLNGTKLKEENFCLEFDFKNKTTDAKLEELNRFVEIRLLENEKSSGELLGKNQFSSKPIEGQKFIVVKKEFEKVLLLDRHVKLVFFFEDMIALFSDPRIFGQFTVVTNKEALLRLSEIENLGPDILDEPFDSEKFIMNLKKHPKLQIGTALLRTDIVLGIGNIYRSEALFRARISPFKRISDISQQDLYLLADKIHEVGVEALKFGGSSIQSYVNTEGRVGGMQERFLVYGRENEKCVICGTMISKAKLDGRSVYWCENCQQ